jgi:Trk K+ transport system NAD-binding subunit
LTEPGHFVVCGLSRLTVRVAQLLVDHRSSVTVIAARPDDELTAALDDRVVRRPAGTDLTATLATAGLGEAECLLALDDDDVDNLRAAVCATAVAPDVPIVLRAFEPALAEQLQASGHVRRAYSVSALAAPTFVAAGLGEEVVETLRLGQDEVPLCRLTVRTGSPLASTDAVARLHERGCTVVAARRADGAWMFGDPVSGCQAGDEVLVGGRLQPVLELAVANRERATGSAARAPIAPQRRRRQPTLVPAAGLALLLVFALATVVLGSALHLRGIDAVYAAFTTGWGNPDLAREPGWLQVFGVVTMIAVGALAGILFAQVAAVATAARLDVREGRRAARSRDHVVVVGLGNVGYRIERLLSALRIQSVVLERDAESRFAAAVSAHAPVLTGDASLPENLQRAGIERAACIVAVTHDDLVNLTACLHARRLNPRIRTVARVFDDTLVEHAGDGLGVDAVVSGSRAAASAFFGAATDERAVRRWRLGDLDVEAVRVRTNDLAAVATGVRVLAEDPETGTAVVAGPAGAVESLLSR